MKDVKVRMSEQEHRVLKMAAASAGLSMSGFIVMVAMEEAQKRLGKAFWEIRNEVTDETSKP